MRYRLSRTWSSQAQLFREAPLRGGCHQVHPCPDMDSSMSQRPQCFIGCRRTQHTVGVHNMEPPKHSILNTTAVRALPCRGRGRANSRVCQQSRNLVCLRPQGRADQEDDRGCRRMGVLWTCQGDTTSTGEGTRREGRKPWADTQLSQQLSSPGAPLNANTQRGQSYSEKWP